MPLDVDFWVVTEASPGGICAGAAPTARVSAVMRAPVQEIQPRDGDEKMKQLQPRDGDGDARPGDSSSVCSLHRTASMLDLLLWVPVDLSESQEALTAITVLARRHASLLSRREIMSCADLCKYSVALTAE